jgi:hypothetical protein
VLSHPETLAYLGCFETPVEDWPVSNPFVVVPARGGAATAHVVQSGDLVLTDTSPWIDGAWSDTANADSDLLRAHAVRRP